MTASSGEKWAPKLNRPVSVASHPQRRTEIHSCFIGQNSIATTMPEAITGEKNETAVTDWAGQEHPLALGYDPGSS